MKKASLISSFLLAAGMMLGGAAPAQDTIFTDMPKKSMTALRKDFSRSSLGREILKFADKNNITIKYDRGWLHSSNNAEYDHDKNLVTLDRFLSRSEELIYLAHEVYHAWEEKYVDYPRLENDAFLPPHWFFALRQHSEGSAAAFSAYYWAQREYELGPDSSSHASARAERSAAKDLLAEMKGDGLTLDEYRSLALEPLMADLHNFAYPIRHLKLAERPLDRLESSLCTAKYDYSFGRLGGWWMSMEEMTDKFNATPDSTAFDALLRKMGGITLDPQAPTALTDTNAVDGNKLFRDYPAMHMVADTAAEGPALRVSTEPPANLGALSARFDAARDKFRRLNEKNASLQNLARIWLPTFLFSR